MAFLIATPKATDANSYLTVARANEILRTRLATKSWDDAASVNTADGYQAAASASASASQIAIDTGTGTFSIGCVIKFAGHATEYVVTTALTGAGTLKFSPALTAGVADNEAITRLTASDREKALIWATSLLDGMIDWFGVIRTDEQRLRWPRSGVLKPDGYNYDYDTIPEPIEQAAAYLAVMLLDRDRFSSPSLLGQGFVRAKMGPMEVEVDPRQQELVIPQNILALISHMGELKNEAAGGGIRSIPLRRA